MAFDENLKVWMDGEFVALKDAKISVLSHVVHYGTAVFEGIRCYETENLIPLKFTKWKFHLLKKKSVMQS